MFNDEEDDENSIGAVRYPCMPSLVSLQQMRNRLHLAYLGRKLMKWTALATGRELRRLSAEIDAAYRSFGEDMRNAFILLARGRYFYPNLNKMVLENVTNVASVRVASNFKTISGVKVLEYTIIESGTEPYEHLGIEKGGQKIHEAKIAWLELLKRMVLMLELRTSFDLVDKAHKNATKRSNVLSKVVVPRTKASCAYITSELEELARENFFRLKKILDIKKKMRALKCHHKTPVDNCLACKEKFKSNVLAECEICGTELPYLIQMEPIPDDEEHPVDKTNESMLEMFRRNISGIIDITEDMKGRGIAAASVDKFLKTASELRDRLGNEKQLKEENTVEPVCKHEEKLEHISSDVSLEKLCETCTIRFEEEQAAKGAKLQRIREEEEQAKLEAARLVKTKEQNTAVDLELGVFETEYQQITRIIRIKNEDGTITEERKVIKTKKETKAPVKPPEQESEQGGSLMFQSSGTSSKSAPYSSGSKAVGIVSVKDRSILRVSKGSVDRKARSEMVMFVSSMVCPMVRYCISSPRMIHSSSNCDYYFMTVVNSIYKSSDVNLKELYNSRSESVVTLNNANQTNSSNSNIDLRIKSD